MKRFLGYFFGLTLLSVVSFFFWGSSANWTPNKYTHFYSHITNSPSKGNGLDTFSIVTYNIGYLSGMTNNKAIDRSKKMFTNNLDKTIKMFQDVNPDFIAFQEIDFDADRSFNIDQLQEISYQVSFNYSAQAVNWDKSYVPFPYWPIDLQFGKVISGQAVVSQHEIFENEIYTLVKPEANPYYYNEFYLDRLAQVTKIRIDRSSTPETKGANQQTVVIINVHLEAFHPETRDKQIKTVLDLFDSYAKTNPVILCGDFNSTPPNASNPWQDDQVIELLLAHPEMKMAIDMKENQTNESNYYTFNSKTPNLRIDYFFYNPKFIEVIDARVLTEAQQISDHLPVWMKFILL